MNADTDWMKRAAMAAYALAEIERELAAFPTPFNERLLEIARRGLADLRGVR
jgi:hypothetical protein